MTFTVDLPDEIAGTLKAQAEGEGMTAEDWLRRLVEERLNPEQEDDRPVSEMIRDIWADMPDEVRAKLPRDGASQVDHCVYGLSPKSERQQAWRRSVQIAAGSIDDPTFKRHDQGQLGEADDLSS